MAETSELERAIAALLLGGLPPGDEARVRERLQKDPSARRLEQQMRQTLGALGAWREAHGALPHPAIPQVRRSPFRIAVPLAAAAAVLVAAAVGLLTPGTPAPDLSGELSWTSAPPTPPEGMWAYRSPAGPPPPEEKDPKGVGSVRGGGGYGAAPQGGLRTEGPGKTVGGPRTGGETGDMIGAPSRRGPQPEAPKAGAAPPRDLAAFVRQFEFPFRAPRELPGGWSLAQASPRGKSRLHLAYEAGGRKADVFLAASPGPDAVPRAAGSLVAARRRGVLVAFSRDAFPEDLWDRVVEEFLK